jgi:hypothetical protein
VVTGRIVTIEILGKAVIMENLGVTIIENLGEMIIASLGEMIIVTHGVIMILDPIGTTSQMLDVVPKISLPSI